MSHVIRYAAVRYHTNSEAYLDGVADRIQELPKMHIEGDKTKPTYGEYFAPTKWIISNVAIHYPATATEFLDSVVSSTKELRKKYPADDSPLRESQLIDAAYHNPSDPEAYLRRRRERFGKPTAGLAAG